MPAYTQRLGEETPQGQNIRAFANPPVAGDNTMQRLCLRTPAMAKVHPNGTLHLQGKIPGSVLFFIYSVVVLRNTTESREVVS